MLSKINFLPDIPPYDESALMQQIAEGNEKAFADLYRMYVPRLTPFVYGITKNNVMVDEMIQEAFLRLWINRDKLSEVRNPKAWIYKITANICYTYIKRLIIERKVLDTILEQSTLEDLSTEQDIYLRSLTQSVKEAVEQLPPQRKKIYLMSREQGMSLGEISAQLNLSMPTVKNTITSSLQFIREQLQKKGYSISLIYFLLTISTI